MLALLTSWRGYVLCACLGLACGWLVQGWRMDTKIARMQADQAQQMADAQALARATEQARWAKMEGIINDAKTQTAAALADSDRARAAAERLRAQITRLRDTARDSAAAGRGQSLEGADPIGLLIRVLGRLDEAGRNISGYADQLRVAGLACQNAYDSLGTGR